jgi:hypothetical protein
MHLQEAEAEERKPSLPEVIFELDRVNSVAVIPKAKRKQTVGPHAKHRKTSVVGGKRKASGPGPEAHKVSSRESLSKKKASIHHRESLKIKSLEDIQLIFSDGKIDTLDLPNLKQRQAKVLKSLTAEFEPPDRDSLAVGTMDYERSKRDLMRNFKGRSHTYQIVCLTTSPQGEEDTLMLDIHCPVQQPHMILLDESNRIDFGPVPLFGKALREVHLYNVSEGPLDLKLDILNPYGPFTRVNALRKLTPDHVFTLKFKCSPQEVGVVSTFFLQFSILQF